MITGCHFFPMREAVVVIGHHSSPAHQIESFSGESLMSCRYFGRGRLITTPAQVAGTHWRASGEQLWTLPPTLCLPRISGYQTELPNYQYQCSVSDIATTVVLCQGRVYHIVWLATHT